MNFSTSHIFCKDKESRRPREALGPVQIYSERLLQPWSKVVSSNMQVILCSWASLQSSRIITPTVLRHTGSNFFSATKTLSMMLKGPRSLGLIQPACEDSTSGDIVGRCCSSVYNIKWWWGKTVNYSSGHRFNGSKPVYVSVWGNHCLYMGWQEMEHVPIFCIWLLWQFRGRIYVGD